MFATLTRLSLVSLLGVSLSACVAGPTPRNAVGAAWMPQQADWRVTACTRVQQSLPPLPVVAIAPGGRHSQALAPGDRLRIQLLGDNDRLSGLYVVAADGSIALPGLAPWPVSGKEVTAVQAELTQMLINARIVRASVQPVRVSLIQSAGVRVAVSGAVFDPGSVSVGDHAADQVVGQRDGTTYGDANMSRSLSAALRAAGGVRPDADLGRIGIVRNGQLAVVSVEDFARGGGGDDVSLLAGDRIIVPSTGCFDANLARPTSVTAPGIRVYLSNLSRPAASNASSGINHDSTSLPYGTRMLQALVASNCVGGSAMNAGRRAVLISRNPMTGRSVVIERAVENLVRDAGRDDVDPYLMPYDSIACYDSRWMNIADVINLAGSVTSNVTTAVVLGNAAR
jgi:polysaccharide export outer membrane protein